LPLVRQAPFNPDGEAGKAASERKFRRGLGDYLAPGLKTIEADYTDDRMNLVCVGRVSAAAVMKHVRRVAMNVLAVGAAAILAVLALGLMLLQAFRRARSFEKEQLVARFEALQAKINPHFLFNTLDSMIGVAEARDFDTLMRMLKALSSMLHMSVRRTRDIVTVAEELEYVRSYIAIQEVRYRDRFTWSVELDPAAADARVCRFGIQPVVENCFTHGVYEGREGMRIEVSVRAEGKRVVVEVRDDGPGCSPETASTLRQSFARTLNRTGREGGLFNVHDRIRMIFGPPYGLELVDSDAGFRIRMTLPGAGGPAKEIL
jgi:sensor histidine kinase YesM